MVVVAVAVSVCVRESEIMGVGGKHDGEGGGEGGGEGAHAVSLRP